MPHPEVLGDPLRHATLPDYVDTENGQRWVGVRKSLDLLGGGRGDPTDGTVLVEEGEGRSLQLLLPGIRVWLRNTVNGHGLDGLGSSGLAVP